jgi:Uma2 family endonuclease
LRTVADYMQMPDDGRRYELPSAEKRDSFWKRKIFTRSGVHELWLVLPEKRQSELYRFAEDRDHPVQTMSETGQFTSALFSRLTIKGADIFFD